MTYLKHIYLLLILNLLNSVVDSVVEPADPPVLQHPPGNSNSELFQRSDNSEMAKKTVWKMNQASNQQVNHLTITATQTSGTCC